MTRKLRIFICVIKKKKLNDEGYPKYPGYLNFVFKTC